MESRLDDRPEPILRPAPKLRQTRAGAQTRRGDPRLDRCPRQARNLCAALQSVECLDTLGDHTADPRARVDAALEPCGVDRAEVRRQSVRLRQACARTRLVNPGDAGRRTVDQPSARGRGMLVSAMTSAAALSAVVAARRRRPVPATIATAVQMALTLVYWEQMVRCIDRPAQ